MGIISRNNRTYESLKNKFRKVLPEQRMFFAKSGHGKGLAIEQFVEKWKQATNGIVIMLADPKNEGEGSFVMYEPTEPYHVEQLKSDGAKPQRHKCKLYHPFSFNVPKGYLPDINFFTMPIKDMGREEWSILAEKSWDSEAIRILLRVSETLGRNKGLVEFLLAVEKFVEGKKKEKKKMRDPTTGLKVSGGTSKSVTEISNLLHSFRVNYFLRKETCEYRINWKSILTDSEHYHVFLSMWLKDEKLKEFMALTLLQQIIENRHFTKKPILIVIPEVRILCPRNPQGYKLYLSQAITNALSTMRSQGRGISSALDSQNWSDTDDKIKGSATITYFGGLSTKDGEIVCKAMNYKRDIRENLQSMKHNHYLVAGQEDFGSMRFFMPRHMHKEPQYNWIEMYHRYYPDKEKRYNQITEFMRNELKKEKNIISELIKKEEDSERRESERKAIKKGKATPEPKNKIIDTDKNLRMKLVYEMKNDDSLEKREKTWRKIGIKFEMSHLTAKKYYGLYEKKQSEMEDLDKELLGNMIGDGVMVEEIDEMSEFDKAVNDIEK